MQFTLWEVSQIMVRIIQSSIHQVRDDQATVSLPEHHPCTLPCHAPSSCTELEPCLAVITLTCPCGRIRHTVPCARSTSNPSGCESTLQPKCNNECGIAKRNARLAEALGINTENREKATVTFNDELTSFARANPKLLSLAEKTFAQCVGFYLTIHS